MKLRINPWLVFLCLGLALAACSSPDKAGKVDKAKTVDVSDEEALARAIAIVEKSSDGIMQADSVFDGPDGLRGILVFPVHEEGGPQVVWASRNVEVLLPTEAYDQEGLPINQKTLEELSMETGPEALSKAIEGRGFIVGEKGPLLTAFVDPNCIHCKHLHDRLAPFIEEGRVRVRFVMVGLVANSSVGRSAMISASEDPGKALAEDKARFDELAKERDKKIEELDTVFEQRVIEDTQTLARHAEATTPTLLFCRKGQSAEIHVGAPPVDTLEKIIDELDEQAQSPACRI